MAYKKLRRIWSAVTPELDDKLTALAKERGMTKSTLISLYVQFGMQAMERAINPERAFKTEQWAEILSAMTKHHEGGEE